MKSLLFKSACSLGALLIVVNAYAKDGHEHRSGHDHAAEHQNHKDHAATGGAHNHGSPYGSNTEAGLKIGGILESSAAFLSQDVDAGRRDHFFYNDSEVHITYTGVADNGLTYGAAIELEADVTEAAREEGENADKTYIFLETNLGRAELGANADAGSRLSVNSASYARGTGGIHGNWHELVAYPEEPGHTGGGHHAGHNSYIHAPALPLHHAHGAAADANKVTLFTPSINGFQFGASYIPDSGDVGTAAGITGKGGHREFENVLNGGVRFGHEFDGGLGLALSATGETGQEDAPGHGDLKAYALGGSVSYAGFTVGGSVGDWNESLTHAGDPSAEYFDIGAAYATGPFGVSLGYFQSEYKHNETEVVAVSADYALVPGLVVYGEVLNVSLDSANPLEVDNDAVVGIFGTRITF